MSSRPERPNLFFRLVTIAGGAFIVTVLALSAMMLGNSNAPAVRFLDRHAETLIAVEVAAILVFGLCAMAADRDRRRSEAQRETNADDAKRGQSGAAASGDEEDGPIG